MKTVNKIWTTSLGIVGLIAGVALTAWGFASHFYPIILGSVGAILMVLGGAAEGYVYGASKAGVNAGRNVEHSTVQASAKV
jgi:hypothetical protein